ncbi:MAG: hypothetical protein AMS18_01955 [Gemmatimonas sp. SG8_17]|nr:MAG: hypothetical protein AMS18_01955 [Gemmatimonas sp. SG8_17]
MVETTEKVHSRVHVGSILPFDAKADSLLGAKGHIDGLILLLEILDVRILADLHFALQFHSDVEDLLNLGVENFLGKSIARDAVAQHSPGLLHRLEHRHTVAAPGQLVGAGQAARSATHHGDLLGLPLVAQPLQRQPSLDAVVADRPFDFVDVDRALQLLAVAFGLARRRANTSTHRWERAGVGIDIEGFFEGLIHGLPQPFRLADSRHELPD